ncbi:MAG: prenyltransferase [Myxococcales bacterium]|nr:prenyltransferase [Myxococcales bacterium]
MASVLDNWSEVLRTQNLSSEREMDLVSRWLLIIRASVFPMTITSAAIGGLLAWYDPTVADANGLNFALATLGLVLAHAANNMINDYFDTEGGVDTEGYVRTEYAPHPIFSGLISKTGLITAIVIVNLIDLAILVYFAQELGAGVAAFALAGLFVSVFYVAPPFKLKHRGLGEPGVFIVWGPLMIGGTYYVTAGQFAPWVLVASLPYALLVMTVLIGKHCDKFEADQAKGIKTLPVILGKERSLFLNQFLMWTFMALVGILVLLGTLPVFTLAAWLAIPRMLAVQKVFGEPRPSEKPENFPIWPLWYVAWAFLFTRFAGGLFIAGLLLGAIWPIHL